MADPSMTLSRAVALTHEEKRRNMNFGLRQRGPNGHFTGSNRGSGQSDSWLDKRSVYRRARYADVRPQNKGALMLLLASEGSLSIRNHPIYPAPIVRNADGGPELTMARWGMPSSSKALMDATAKRAAKLEAKGK